MSIKDRDWTPEQLERLNNLLETWGPVSQKLSQMTSIELAKLALEHLWGDLSIVTPHSALVEEIADRLLIQGDFVRGDQEAPIPEEWEL